MDCHTGRLWFARVQNEVANDCRSDSNRLSAKVGWNLPYTSPLGDIYTLRATLRGDGYYVRDVVRPSRNDTFTGTAGRVLPEASLEWRFPFVRNDGKRSRD